MRMKILVALFFFWGSVRAQAPQNCTLPTGEKGSCVPWTGCPPYQSHIDAGRNSAESTKFLRERICHFDPPNAWLCCPVQVQVKQTVLEAPDPVHIPEESECGTNPNKEKNDPGAWPWLAAIGRFDDTKGFLPICAGALISRRHVLSSASCFTHHRNKLVVRLGEYDIENDRAGEQPQDFRIILFNTDHYNISSQENDIAILPLDRDVVFTRNIYPVCLPFPLVGQDLTGKLMTVVGWGRPETGSNEHSRVPVAGNLPVASQSVCAANYKQLGAIISNKQICAGDGSTDACSGDGGAPLNYYSQEKDKYYVTGLVSFGVGCGHVNYPGVYTRVTSYLPWINTSINTP